ncbi:MAG: hypothetical protein DGJ47_000946, partial [Rickettsiaceae bacterium]
PNAPDLTIQQTEIDNVIQDLKSITSEDLKRRGQMEQLKKQDLISHLHPKDRNKNYSKLAKNISQKMLNSTTNLKSILQKIGIECNAQESLKNHDLGHSVCFVLPCMDGNCFDQSYDTNGAMMSSLAMLHAVQSISLDGDQKFNLFCGNKMNCSRKTTGYSNCCRKNMVGWGKSLGARCSSDEKLLNLKRSQGHCHYIGKQKKKRFRITVAIKERFCCFNTTLDRIIQEQGRVQIGKSWGSPSSPNCSGFTLNEIQRIDFTKIDFKEFIKELQHNVIDTNEKIPNISDIQKYMQSKNQNDFGVRKYNENGSNLEKNRSGWNNEPLKELGND